jgi:hypothetical protein
MTEQEAFERWKSQVEVYLELMVKKSIFELPYYNYKRDFNNNVQPEETATRVIQQSYKAS